LCDLDRSELVDPSSANAIALEGRVLDGVGDAVPDAMVEIWQADETGSFRADFGWGRCGTDESGRYRFATLLPGAVVLEDGTVQAPHITMAVYARGLQKPVVTRVYFPGDERNALDPVLTGVADAARESLIARLAEGAFTFDVVLQGEGQTAFFLPST
jgi:protocatechuate 3,4-dioxygenase alpha subunit